MVLMFINTFSFFIMEKAINAYATSPFIDREKLQCHSFGPHKGCFSKVYAQWPIVGAVPVLFCFPQILMIGTSLCTRLLLVHSIFNVLLF